MEPETGEVSVSRIAYLIVLLGCCLGVAQVATVSPRDYAHNPNPVLFPKQSHLPGA
jgi:hypothetical protein